MPTSRYLEAPVAGDTIRDFFVIRDEKSPLPLTLELAEVVADQINNEVTHSHEAVWMNPETDSRQVKIHGRPLDLGGRALKLVGGEVAIFPPRNKTF